MEYKLYLDSEREMKELFDLGPLAPLDRLEKWQQEANDFGLMSTLDASNRQVLATVLANIQQLRGGELAPLNSPTGPSLGEEYPEIDAALTVFTDALNAFNDEADSKHDERLRNEIMAAAIRLDQINGTGSKTYQSEADEAIKAKQVYVSASQDFANENVSQEKIDDDIIILRRSASRVEKVSSDAANRNNDLADKLEQSRQGYETVEDDEAETDDELYVVPTPPPAAKVQRTPRPLLVATRQQGTSNEDLRNLYKYINFQYEFNAKGLIDIIDAADTTDKTIEFVQNLALVASTIKNEVNYQVATDLTTVEMNKVIDPKPSSKPEEIASILAYAEKKKMRIQDLKNPPVLDPYYQFSVGIAVGLATSVCLMKERNQQHKKDTIDLIRNQVLDPLVKLIGIPRPASGSGDEKVLDTIFNIKGHYQVLTPFNATDEKSKLKGQRETIARNEAKLALIAEGKGDQVKKSPKAIQAQIAKTSASIETRLERIRLQRGDLKSTRELGAQILILLALTRENFADLIYSLDADNDALTQEYDRLVLMLTQMVFGGVVRSMVEQKNPLSSLEEPWIFGAWIALDRVRKLSTETFETSKHISGYLEYFTVALKKGTGTLWLKNENHFDGPVFDRLLDVLYISYLTKFAKPLQEYKSSFWDPDELARYQVSLDWPMLFAPAVKDGETRQNKKLASKVKKKVSEGKFAAQRKKNRDSVKNANEVLGEIEDKKEAKDYDSAKTWLLAESAAYLKNARAQIPGYDDFATITLPDLIAKSPLTAEEKDILDSLNEQERTMGYVFRNIRDMWTLVRERKYLGGIKDQPRLESLGNKRAIQKIYNPSLQSQISIANGVNKSYLGFMQTRATHIYLQTIWLKVILRLAPPKKSSKERAQEKANRAAAEEKLRVEKFAAAAAGEVKQGALSLDDLFAGPAPFASVEPAAVAAAAVVQEEAQPPPPPQQQPIPVEAEPDTHPVEEEDVQFIDRPPAAVAVPKPSRLALNPKPSPPPQQNRSSLVVSPVAQADATFLNRFERKNRGRDRSPEPIARPLRKPPPPDEVASFDIPPSRPLPPPRAEEPANQQGAASVSPSVASTTPPEQKRPPPAEAKNKDADTSPLNEGGGEGYVDDFGGGGAEAPGGAQTPEDKKGDEELFEFMADVRNRSLYPLNYLRTAVLPSLEAENPVNERKVIVVRAEIRFRDNQLYAKEIEDKTLFPTDVLRNDILPSLRASGEELVKVVFVENELVKRDQLERTLQLADALKVAQRLKMEAYFAMVKALEQLR